MKIAQVAPLIESVPPKRYGGTERIVSYLTEELVAAGHEVTLFASGDSITSARLKASCPKSLRVSHQDLNAVAYSYLQLEEVFREGKNFDLIHFHNDYLHFPFSKRERIPNVTTLHGRLDQSFTAEIFNEYPRMPVISISNAQRHPLPSLNWVGTVYHGIPKHKYTLGEGKGDYLLFLGRISPEKRADRAIAMAMKSGIPLKIAAKVDRLDEDYFKKTIQPLLKQNPYVEFLGEVGDSEKNELLGNAKALLFPIDWPEPFGLVLIESLACGTPVIAYRNGSVPEILTDGVTGFIISHLNSAAAAVKRIETLSRLKCREIFEERFTAQRMAQDYIRQYQRVLGAQNWASLWGRRGRHYSAERPILRSSDLIAS